MYLSGGGGDGSNGAVITTIGGGNLGQISLQPLSGYLLTPIYTTFPGGTIYFSNSSFVGLMQTLPGPATFTQMSGPLALESPLALTGTTVTIFAQLFKYVAGNGTAGRVSGTICTFSPALTGAVSAGNISTCSVTGFSATYAAGDMAFIVIRATAAGVSLLNTISFDASIGVQ